MGGKSDNKVFPPLFRRRREQKSLLKRNSATDFFFAIVLCEKKIVRKKARATREGRNVRTFIEAQGPFSLPTGAYKGPAAFYAAQQGDQSMPPRRIRGAVKMTYRARVPTGQYRSFMRQARSYRQARLRRAGYGSIPPGMRRRLAPEVKTVDTTVAAMNFDNNSAVAGTMLLLNTIAQDASPTGRIGKKIVMKGVHMHLRINAGTATIGEKCALLLVYVRTNNQAATLPAWTEVLTTQSATSQTNRDNASKFKIVRRWDFNIIGNVTAPATGQELKCIDEFVPFKKGLESLWTNAGTAGTIGQFEKGSLILMSVGINGNGATTTPVANGTTRVYFLDV